MKSSVHIERAIQSIEDVRAFSYGDAMELAGQIVDDLRPVLPKDVATDVLHLEITNQISKRLKDHIGRFAAIEALREVL
jgi:hypothetical protein